MFSIKTKDHLVYFMQTGVLKLSNYDLKFVQNLQHFIVQGVPITTNQVTLFEKILFKYSRQLLKHKLTNESISNLQWHCKIITSDPKYTESYISIVDGKIFFKAPFNKNFVSTFRNLQYNTFVWNKDLKRYESDFGTHALKTLLEVTNKYFTKSINYCDITTSLINSTIDYKNNKVWQPTLVNINNNYYILAANEYLMDSIKDINLSSDFNTLCNLAEYGIHAHESVTNNDKKLIFAANIFCNFNIDDIDLLIECLLEMKCNSVFYIGQGSLPVYIRNKMNSKLINNMIDYKHTHVCSTNSDNTNSNVVVTFTGITNTHFSKFNNLNIKKVISITNTTAIDIK